MAKKKKVEKNIENKALKTEVKNKATIIDGMVTIIGKKSRHLKEGVEYTVTPEKAELLVNKGVAKYK